MSKKVNTTMLGGFVIGGLVLLVIAIILFGGEGIFTRRELVIMYFGGSVNGLNVGAPVTARGVEIGTVTSIEIMFNTETGELRVPVIAEIDAVSIDQVRRLQMDDPLEAIIRDLGLRAQLQIQSILTSQLYIELDYHPGTEINYFGDGSMIEIPTVPMPFEQFGKALNDISLEQMMVDISSSLSALNKLVSTPDLVDTITSIKKAFVSVDALSNDLREKFVPLADDAAGALAEARTGLQELKLALNDVRKLTGEDSPQIQKLNVALDEFARTAQSLQKLDAALTEVTAAARAVRTFEDTPQMYNLNSALEEISAAARAVRLLADTLERNPESLLQGKSTGDQ
jgi:paraquat-inducible protein B